MHLVGGIIVGLGIACLVSAVLFALYGPDPIFKASSKAKVNSEHKAKVQDKGNGVVIFTTSSPFINRDLEDVALAIAKYKDGYPNYAVAGILPLTQIEGQVYGCIAFFETNNSAENSGP